jgi:hypothetical protein
LSTDAFREIVESTDEQRRTFFKMIFGPEASGYACIAFLEHTTRKMQQLWWEYPKQLDEMLISIQENSKRLAHFYFSTALYEAPGNREKQHAQTSTIIHCDLDSCDPRLLLVDPTLLVQSSPGRFQAYWVLDHPVHPAEAEDINRRIAYYHKDQGADMCHDAGHLMRIPYTPNYKHGDLDTAPVVVVLSARPSRFRLSDFSVYPNVVALKFMDQQDVLPELPNETSSEIVERYKAALPTIFYHVFDTVPAEKTWSEVLWHLMSLCMEAGLTKVETFLVARDAKCNKYARDGRPETELYRDVCRLYVKQIEKLQLAPTTNSEIPELLSPNETKRVQAQVTFVERYMAWAGKKTDAPRQYHQAGAFIILSALLAGNICLPTSHSKVYPNMWFMLLAGTTLTRKSTAMRIAMELLREVNSDAEMATDGSAEGILTGLRDRPGQPSIFLKDEFTGLLDSIAHKDYMAGFAEQLTKLYDGDDIKRLLRKESIHVKDPRFIILAAGIKDKTQMLLTEEHVMSGFIPRFVFVTGEGDPANVQPTGPPRPDEDLEQREQLINELIDMYNHYAAATPIMQGNKVVGSMPTEFAATLTQDAWARFNVFETQMRNTALSTTLAHLVPVHERLSMSTLKAAVLIAASRKRVDDGLVVEEIDILHAIYYAQFWRQYVCEVVNGIGKTQDERLIDRIYEQVRKNDTGVNRADLIFGTMIQRNMVFLLDVNGQKRYRAAVVK